jgi:hypothetical protein
MLFSLDYLSKFSPDADKVVSSGAGSSDEPRSTILCFINDKL